MTLQHDLKTPDGILHAALEKETQSRDFYTGLAAHCTVDYVKQLLEKLEDEESKHMHMIQGMLERLNSGRDIV
jgi:rubrerythrin